MLEIGRVCYKIAGRDGNNICVVVDKVDDTYVLVDGNVRRKKVNVAHLEPTGKTVNISAKADTAAVQKALEDAGFAIVKTGDARKTVERPKKSKIQHEKKAPVKESKKTEKAVKEVKPVEKKTDEKKTSKLSKEE